jgi:hypothetical protein
MRPMSDAFREGETMKTMWKAMLLAGCAWSAVSTGAYAQDVAASGDTEVGEVVVTARRREDRSAPDDREDCAAGQGHGVLHMVRFRTI